MLRKAKWNAVDITLPRGCKLTEGKCWSLKYLPDSSIKYTKDPTRSMLASDIMQSITDTRRVRIDQGNESLILGIGEYSDTIG